MVGTDDIGTASNDAMLAFSQIVEAGQNPMAVAGALEKEIANKNPKPSAPLNDDAAMASFSEYIATD